MCGSMVDIQTPTAEIRQRKHQEEEERNHSCKNRISASVTQAGHNNTRMWTDAQRDDRLPNIGGHSGQRRKVWLTPTTRVPCSNAAKTRNQLKLAGVPKTNEQISAASGPKFTILWGHVKEILLLDRFFPIVDMCLSCEDIARQSCPMVRRWRILAIFAYCIFSEAHADMHLKFALRPHRVWKYGIHPICDGWD